MLSNKCLFTMFVLWVQFTFGIVTECMIDMIYEYKHTLFTPLWVYYYSVYRKAHKGATQRFKTKIKLLISRLKNKILKKVKFIVANRYWILILFWSIFFILYISLLLEKNIINFYMDEKIPIKLINIPRYLFYGPLIIYLIYGAYIYDQANKKKIPFYLQLISNKIQKQIESIFIPKDLSLTILWSALLIFYIKLITDDTIIEIIAYDKNVVASPFAIYFCYIIYITYKKFNI